MKRAIYFTVSMWNRMEHFELLLRDLTKVYHHDNDIVLHAVDFCTVPLEKLQQLADRAPFPVKVWQIRREFCNGMGHNTCIQHIKDQDSIVAVIAVDLQMPPTITDEIRQHAIPGKSFYGPMIRYACKDGELRWCRAAYALIAAGKRDLDRAGSLRQNMQWGGDRREGGEDTILMKRLKDRAKLRQSRPRHPGLVCRWHERNITQTFYKSYRRYYTMPWWSLVDGNGKPVPKVRHVRQSHPHG